MCLRWLAVLLLAVTSLAASPKPEEPPAIIGQWIAAQQHMGDISVSFKLTRTLPTMKNPIITEGHFWRMADGRFRWELGTPPATTLLYDNHEVHLWDSTKQKWQQLSPNDGSMRMWLHFLNSKELSADSLTRDFTATITGNDPKVTTIALQPKGMMVRRHLKQIDLQIDPTKFFLRQIRLIQSDDATVLMGFSDPGDFSENDKRTVSFQP